MAVIETGVGRRTGAAVESMRGAVVGWITAGVVILAIEAYAVIHWLASGQAHRTPTGPDPIPTSMKVEAHVFEVVGWVASALLLYFLLYRPWRKGKRVGDDLLMVVVCGSMFWLDPLFVFTHHWSNYNGAFVNLGSWAQLPGSPDHTAHAFPEALIFASSLYLAMVFGGVAAGCWFMRLVARRWSGLPTAVVAVSGLVFLLVLDILLEGFVFVRLGLYVFPGSYGPMLNAGHYYQFPILYAVCVTTTWWAWALVRYFRDENGLTVAERGLDRIARSPGQRRVVRFMALAGLMNVLGLALFVVPMNLISLHQHPWPADFTHRSYLWGGACTTAAQCPIAR